jgi:hypothetical protein
LLSVSGAFGAAVSYSAFLTGPGESPPNASPGVCTANVTIDLVAHLLTVDITFSGLLGTTTASHIHAPTAVPFTGTAGVATQTPFFTGFPTGVTSGSYSHVFDTLDAATYNGTYVTNNGGTAAGAESALASALAAGEAYLNIHSSAFGGGEIRGFLVADAPEPGTFLWAGAVVLGLVLRRRR